MSRKLPCLERKMLFVCMELKDGLWLTFYKNTMRSHHKLARKFFVDIPSMNQREHLWHRQGMSMIFSYYVNWESRNRTEYLWSYSKTLKFFFTLTQTMAYLLKLELVKLDIPIKNRNRKQTFVYVEMEIKKLQYFC